MFDRRGERSPEKGCCFWQLKGGNQLAIYKRRRGFEVGTTENNNNNCQQQPIQDYVHPDDQTQPTFSKTPGFKPFTEPLLL